LSFFIKPARDRGPDAGFMGLFYWLLGRTMHIGNPLVFPYSVTLPSLLTQRLVSYSEYNVLVAIAIGHERSLESSTVPAHRCPITLQYTLVISIWSGPEVLCL